MEKQNLGVVLEQDDDSSPKIEERIEQEKKILEGMRKEFVVNDNELKRLKRIEEINSQPLKKLYYQSPALLMPLSAMAGLMGITSFTLGGIVVFAAGTLGVAESIRIVNEKYGELVPTKVNKFFQKMEYVFEEFNKPPKKRRTRIVALEATNEYAEQDIKNREEEIAALVEQRKAIAQTYTSSSIDKVEDLSFVEELSSELPQDNVTLEKPRQLTLNNQTKRIK